MAPPLAVTSALLPMRRTCIVFPLYPRDLHSVAEEGPVSEADAVAYGRQLLSAVAHLHAAGVSHCDVKLENLLVAEDGVSIVLTDFGLALRSERVGVARGSPFYVSPEAYRFASSSNRGEGYDGKKADVWACSVSLMFLLTQHGVGMTARGELVLPPEHLRSHLSTDAMDFLLQALAVNPDRRPSASTLLQHRWLRCNDAPEPGSTEDREDTAVRLCVTEDTRATDPTRFSDADDSVCVSFDEDDCNAEDEGAWARAVDGVRATP
jgi:serine/threonine protein kinase